jgi:hypothetical protein
VARSVVLPRLAPRRVVIHQHIMKCAGSTIVAVLEREFGEGCYHLHRDDPRGTIFGEDLGAFLEATPDALAVTSHHLRPPLPTGPFLVIDCAPLRDPIDRLASLYRFTRKDASQLLHPLTANGMATFVRAVADRFPDNVIDVQTSALAITDASRPPGRDDLAVAIARMRRSSFLVVVDRFDESMVLAEYFFRNVFPGLQLHSRATNVTRPTEYDLAERERELNAELGGPAFALVKRLSALDEELLAAARAELDRRIALIAGFEERLRAFRARCAELRDSEAARPAR